MNRLTTFKLCFYMFRTICGIPFCILPRHLFLFYAALHENKRLINFCFLHQTAIKSKKQKKHAKIPLAQAHVANAEDDYNTGNENSNF